MSKQGESTNQNNIENKNPKPNEENNQQKEEKPGFFKKYMWYILIFIAIRIGISLFSNAKSNEPKLTGILDEGLKFDINFYLSTREHYSSINDIEPIYTIKNMVYSYNNFSSNSLENEINITYNISYL